MTKRREIFYGTSRRGEHRFDVCPLYPLSKEGKLLSLTSKAFGCCASFSPLTHLTFPPLKKQGAPLDEADHCGDPPLLLAAGNGHTAVCDLLVNEGADLQQAGLMKECPLARASHNGHYQTVKYLVDNGRASQGLILPQPRVYSISQPFH